MAVGAAGEVWGRRGWAKLACVAIVAAAAAGWPASRAHAADPVIAAAGDVACSSSSSNFNGGNGTADRCRMKYTSDTLVNAGLSAVLVLGDAQYENGTLSGFRNSYDLSWGRVKTITRPAAGNHEYQTAGAAGYYDYFNGVGNATGPAGDRSKGYYSFNVGTWHLIALNSTDHCTIISCAAGSAQEQWLKADLAANADKYCTLAYWHDPRFNSGHDGNADEMQPLFQALYNADADVILGGHAHDYERFAPQNPSGQLDNARGIRQFVIGTGGAFFTSVSTPKPNSQVRQNSTYGVLKLTLRPTSYDWQFVSESNKPFTDSGTGQCHGSSAPPPTDTQKPTPPGSLTATAGAGEVALDWNASSDNVGVTGYRIYRGGTQIGTVGTVTSYTDTNVAGNTTYSYTVRAEDATGNLSDPSNTASATTPAQTTFTIAPEADALVNAGAPTTNYATAKLRTDLGSTPEESYLRFNVTGLSGAVATARLRVFAYTASNDGPAVYTSQATWGETTINWNNRPARTSAMGADAGAIATNTWVEYDVKPFVTGNGTYSFNLVATASDGVDFRSREYTTTTQRPELVVTTSGPDTTKPGPPGNLGATGSAGQVALTWQAASDNVGVTGYRVFRGTTQVATLGNVTSYTDTGLAAGNYSYTVRAVDAAGNVSDPTNSASATVPDTTKPGPPGNLTATGSAGQVALNWEAATDDVGVIGYRVHRDGTEIASLPGTASSHTDAGLAPGDYGYTVRAVDAAGNLSDASNGASATVPDTTKPGRPRNLTATPNGPVQADLAWEESSDDVAVTEYEVYRDGSLVTTVPATATSHSDIVLPGTYEYVVRALDAAGNRSDPSNPASATMTPLDGEPPSAPGNLVATVTGGDVDLAWDASLDNTGVAGYRVYRDDVEVADLGAVTSWSDTAVAPGSHSYFVRALDAAGNVSDPSNVEQPTVPDVTAPTAPGGLTATAGAGEVALSWNASTDDVGVTGYSVVRGGTEIASLDGTATSHTDTGLSPGGYDYAVRAVDAAGNVSDPSTAGATVLDTTDPQAPANLDATVTGDRVDLAWDAATDDVAVTGYAVFRDGAEIATLGADPTSYADTAVAPGDYSYTVRAVDAAGNRSAPSDPAGATVPDVAPPSAPAGLTATANGSTQADLSWQASADNVGVTGYEIYRDGASVATIGPATSHSDVVLPGTYAYEVRALDAAGNASDPSDTATVTVYPPDTEAPSTPANLTATVSGGDVDLVWDAASDNFEVTAYEVHRNGALIATIGPITSYTDQEAAPTVSYSYEVRALDGAGNVSDPSEPASATVPDTTKPSAPANLTATATPTQVDLSWEAASDDVAVTGYRVYRDDAPLADLGAVTSWSDTSVTAAGYSYEVRALDAAGNVSDPSNSATATVPDVEKPSAPADLAATAAGPFQVDLTWTASSDNVAVTGYTVYRDGAPVATLGAVTAWSDTGVAGSTAYSYAVRATDDAGNVSDPSAAADVTTPAGSAVLTFAPEADARVHAGSPTTNYATSYLRANGGSEPAVESYLRFTVSGAPAGSVRSAKLRVFAYTGSVDGPAVFTTNPAWTETAVNWNNRPPHTSANADDKGAVPANSWIEYDVTPFVTGDGTYSFGLSTTSGDGVDIRSREAAADRPELIVTTGPPDTQNPTAPGTLDATAAGPGQVDLSWEASGDNVGVTGYVVYRDGNPLTTLGAVTSYSDTTVAADSTYEYAVRAMDGAGNQSDASNTATVTTPHGVTVRTFSPEADALVNAGAPTTNYATAKLRTDLGSTPEESYLRFNVTGVAGTVADATLRVFAYTNSTDGPAVYTSGTSWSETTINWNNRPARTSAIGDDKGAIATNSWVEYDVTPFVSGNGTYSFNLVATAGDGVDFRSREYPSNPPELVVTVP